MILLIENVNDRKIMAGILLENNYTTLPIYRNNRHGEKEIVGMEILKEGEKK